MVAVPSKHDLASLVRSIHAELALAVPAGSTGGRQGLSGGVAAAEAEAGGGGGGGAGNADTDWSLAPLLLKGVVQAVKLLCTKVEFMHCADKVSVSGTALHTFRRLPRCCLIMSFFVLFLFCFVLLAVRFFLCLIL